jgi:small subunit ribosomal protein S4
MARYLGPVCKLCRREGIQLFLKGNRCIGDRCALKKRKSAPGMAGKRTKAASEYGKQLRAKQKIKRWYNLLEKQFKLTFKDASKKKGKTGDNLLIALETRLDSVVFISSLAVSRPQARQLIKHRHIKVNGQIVDIPSYRLKAGDEVEVTEKFKKNRVILESLKNVSKAPTPKWIELDVDNAKLKIASMPERSDIQIPAEEHLVVELYSK